MEQTLILLAAAACLLVALVAHWMRPARKPAKPESLGKLTLGIDCDTAPVLAKLRPLKAELQQIAALAEKIDGYFTEPKTMPRPKPRPKKDNARR